MRGWKIVHDHDDGVLSIGPTRGKAVEIHVEGVAEARGGRRYLLYLGRDEEISDRHLEALQDFLQEGWPGDWDMMSAEVLSAGWGQLSPSEQDRLARREGFTLTRRLP